MADEDAGLPGPDEIRDQLKRMLARGRFQANENASRFLKLVTEMTLRGELITQSIIGAELIGDRYGGSDISDVRVMANTLRKVIGEYYAHEGEDDLVRIELPSPPGKFAPKLPPGKAYTPLFSYNPHSEAAKQYKLGQFYLKRGSYGDYNRAFYCFANAIKAAPNHIGAKLGAAEALCGVLDWEKYPMDEVDQETVELAALWLDRVSIAAAKDWRQYAVGARMLHLYGKRDDAQDNFNIALSLDRSGTESYPPYFAFLADTGKVDEALRLAGKYFDAHLDEINAHAVYADALIHAGRFDEAEKILEAALDMDKAAYKIHLLMGMMRHAQGRKEDSDRHFAQVEALADKDTYELLKLALLKPINPP